jgi:ElaB/YqjD/DUF883 family membrane-anchored ribosome-binding protein
MRPDVLAVNNFGAGAFASSQRAATLLRMDTRERISEMVENPEQVKELAEAVQEQGKELLQTVDEFVRRNPYLAMGIALAVGCAVASLIRSRD